MRSKRKMETVRIRKANATIKKVAIIGLGYILILKSK